MRHLKKFEKANYYIPELKKYFTEKIDWKLIEYIKDLTLQYTDDGWYMQINVSYYSHDIYWYTINTNNTYNATTLEDHDDWMFDDNYDNDYYNLYEYINSESEVKAKIKYYISIHKDLGNTYLPDSDLSKIHDNIKRKFTNLTNNYHLHQGTLTIYQPV